MARSRCSDGCSICLRIRDEHGSTLTEVGKLGPAHAVAAPRACLRRSRSHSHRAGRRQPVVERHQIHTGGRIDPGVDGRREERRGASCSREASASRRTSCRACSDCSYKVIERRTPAPAGSGSGSRWCAGWSSCTAERSARGAGAQARAARSKSGFRKRVRSSGSCRSRPALLHEI